MYDAGVHEAELLRPGIRVGVSSRGRGVEVEVASVTTAERVASVSSRWPSLVSRLVDTARLASFVAGLAGAAALAGLAGLAGCDGDGSESTPPCDSLRTCEKVCESGAGETCERVAWAWENGIEVAPNPTKAEVFWGRACDAGIARGCTRRALMQRVVSGSGEGQAKSIAASLAKRGCDGGDGAGCVLSAEYTGGATARELIERGRSTLTSACDGGQGDRIACIDLARLSLDPPEVAKVMRDVATATALLGAACSRGEAVACYELAEQTRGGVRAEEIPALYEGPCESGLIIACTQWGNELFVSGVDPTKALQTWSRACEAGEPSACTSLASAKLTGAAGKAPEPVAASTLYDRACELGEPRACTQLGLLASTGRGVRAEPERARKLFAMACQAGDVEGCGQHGVMMIRGLGGAADAEGGRRLVERACADGHGPSCTRLATLIAEGAAPTRSDASRDAEVARFHRAACELRDLEGCVALSADHVDGRGVPNDLRLALDLARFACQEGSATGCTLAAEFYRRGQGVSVDDALANRYLREGCRLGDSHGCEKLAGRSEDEESTALWQAALVLRTRGCEEEGKAEDCAVLGTYHLLGFAGKADPALAVKAFARGCEGGQLAACTSLGQILVTGTGVEPDYDRAFATLKLACDGGDVAGCTWLGLCEHKGRGTAVNLESAKTRYSVGCEAGVPFGCIGMARLHEQGDGVKKDAKARRRYLDRACKLGETSACDRAR